MDNLTDDQMQAYYELAALIINLENLELWKTYLKQL